jgi:predicted ferric reductase
MPKTFQKYKLIWILIIASILPILTLLFNNSIDIILRIGNTAGYVGLILFAWEMVLGSRFLVAMLTSRVIKVNKIHMWLGIWATLLVLVHPILSMWSYAQNILWIFVPNFSSQDEIFINFGRFAFVLFLIIWLSSKLIRNYFSYRWWLRLHYLSYPLMFFALIHPFVIGSFFKDSIVIQATVLTLILGLIILTLFRLSFWAGLFKYQYTLVEKMQNNDDTFSLLLQPKGQFIQPNIGQYLYIQANRFGESHPFSIMNYNPDNGQIRLLIKSGGRYTNYLRTLEHEHNLTVDGSYGDFTIEGQNNVAKIIIAGGVGMSVFYPLVTHYPINTTLIISNRNSNQVSYEQLLCNILGSNYFQFITKATNQNLLNVQNTFYQRLGIDQLRKIIENKGVNPAQIRFFICGSKGFNTGISETLKDLNISNNQIFIEDFE